MNDLVENRPEDEAWTCIREIAEVLETFEELVPADVDLVYSEELADHVILAPVNGAIKVEPCEEDD